MSFPKCRVGTKTDHPCQNEASVDPFGTGEYFICEQHYRLQELSNEETDWSIARDYGVATAAFGANGGNFILWQDQRSHPLNQALGPTGSQRRHV